MNLREYLFVSRLTVKDFAALLDYNPAYLSRICVGTLVPGRKLMRRIEKASNGYVKSKDVLCMDSQENSFDEMKEYVRKEKGL